MADLLAAMYSRPDGSDGRQSATIHIADLERMRVVTTTGWSCAPMNPDYWWCPDYGASVCVGPNERAHFVKRQAEDQLMQLMRTKREQLADAIDAIMKERG